MAKVFSECFEKLVQAKGEFTKNQYPLYSFEKVAPEIQEKILKTAERKFNYSHRTITDFYGHLFEELHEAGLSDIDGTEAAGTYLVYYNAMSMFPQFAELPFNERINVLKKAHKKARKSERNLQGMAMNVYLTIVEEGLDNEVILMDESAAMKGSYESPWRVTSKNPERCRTYTKCFQNFKKLQDYDTGSVAILKYPIWTSYIPKENYKGVKRTLLSVELWSMLAQK